MFRLQQRCCSTPSNGVCIQLYQWPQAVSDYPVCNSAVSYMTSIAPASRVSLCQLRDGESVASLAHRCGKGPDALRYDPPKDVFTADASTVKISALCAQATDV